jgi:hypothetical protein
MMTYPLQGHAAGAAYPPVWFGLGDDIRRQAVELLAQLAFNLIVMQEIRQTIQEQGQDDLDDNVSKSSSDAPGTPGAGVHSAVNLHAGA